MRPDADIPAHSDQTAQLEQSFIAEFLQRRGHTAATLAAMPAADALALQREASSYASARLAEVESRAHYVHEIHDASHRE
jgi:hypothetical protein